MSGNLIRRYPDNCPDQQNENHRARIDAHLAFASASHSGFRRHGIRTTLPVRIRHSLTVVILRRIIRIRTTRSRPVRTCGTVSGRTLSVGIRARHGTGILPRPVVHPHSRSTRSRQTPTFLIGQRPSLSLRRLSLHRTSLRRIRYRISFKIQIICTIGWILIVVQSSHHSFISLTLVPYIIKYNAREIKTMREKVKNY